MRRQGGTCRCARRLLRRQNLTSGVTRWLPRVSLAVESTTLASPALCGGCASSAAVHTSRALRSGVDSLTCDGAGAVKRVAALRAKCLDAATEVMAYIRALQLKRCAGHYAHAAPWRASRVACSRRATLLGNL